MTILPNGFFADKKYVCYALNFPVHDDCIEVALNTGEVTFVCSV